VRLNTTFIPRATEQVMRATSSFVTPGVCVPVCSCLSVSFVTCSCAGGWTGIGNVS